MIEPTVPAHRAGRAAGRSAMAPVRSIARAIRLPIAALALALCAATQAGAQEDRVGRILKIYTESCGQFVGAPPELRAHLAQNYVRFSTSEERHFLMGRPGQLWHTPERDPRTQFGIYSFDDGECAVIGNDVPADTMRSALATLMAKLAKATHVRVQLRSDIRQGNTSNETRIMTFAAANPQARRGVEYVLITERTADGDLARLSTTPTLTAP